jgi:hypothetical protein
MISDSVIIVDDPTPSASTLDLTQVRKNQGVAYYIRKDFGIPGNSVSSPRVSTLRLFEDGKELGVPHSPASSIREQGRGKYVHWEDVLLFTASDNSDPRTNGRVYTYTIGADTIKPDLKKLTC